MELEQNAVIETEITPIQKTGGTSDYENLTNKPSINNIELEGNKTLEELGIYNYDDTEIKRDIQSLEDTKVDREVNKGLSTNDYTNEEKSKLASLENYDDTEVKADISALEDIEETQNQEIVNIKANKADKSEIPDVSDFITNSVNDLINYYLKSETYTKTEVNNLIGAINQFHYEIVQALPITGKSNVLYLVPKSTSETENIYNEYVYASGWEKIGDTEIDLSNYVTTTQLNTALADYTTTANLTTLLAGKQNTIDSTHKLDADLVDDTNSTNKFVSAIDKTTWNGKQDALVSGTNIKTINNQSILGSGDITISGGGSLPIYYSGSGIGLYLKNDFEPGLYVTRNSSSQLEVYDLEDTRFRYDIPFGFVWVVKKYSECNVGDIFLVFPDGFNFKSFAKQNNVNGYNTYGYSNFSVWTTKSYVDDKPTTYTGYDATKTQVLKNINGTLTWVNE